MNCALVNAKTMEVENMIVADPSVDQAPEGYILVPVLKDFPFEEQEVWDGQKVLRKEKVKEPKPKAVPDDGLEML